MPAGDLLKSVEELVSEKEAIVGKERQLIQSLNAALNKMGYRIVAMTEPVVRRRGRPPKNPDLAFPASTPRRRGRPPKAAQTGKKVVGRRRRSRKRSGASSRDPFGINR